MKTGSIGLSSEFNDMDLVKGEKNMSNESRKKCFFIESDDLDQDKMDEKELFRKYRAGKEAEERQKMALSEEEKSKYQYIIDEGKKAGEKIICDNQGLVHRIASKYPKRNNTDLQDLIQAGNIGLVKAMREFDLERNTRFSTFAKYKILNEIGSEYLKYAGPIYIPEKMMSEIVTVRNAARDLSVKSGYEPSREEIADYLNWKPEQVDKVRGYDREVVSLYTPVGEDGITCILDLLIDDRAVSPEDQVIRNEKEAYVRKVVNSLPARKRDAVRSRYGFDDDIEHSLNEIGVKLDVSRGRSGQIIERAIYNIRKDPEIREMREDYDR